MRMWLAIAVVALFVPTAAANAQMTALLTQDVASIAKSRTLDLRLSGEAGVPRHVPLMRSLLVSQEVAPNAALGIGLANLYDRKKSGDFRGGPQPRRSNKPAVTFVLRF